MGGPYFLGFSGIITGMIGYILVRQKIAPWEGYNIPNAVFYFIGIFMAYSLITGNSVNQLLTVLGAASAVLIFAARYTPAVIINP